LIEIYVMLNSACSQCAADVCLPGGGERALFEARACGAKVEIADDNSKLQVTVA
jgi:hypothetical protein